MNYKYKTYYFSRFLLLLIVTLITITGCRKKESGVKVVERLGLSGQDKEPMGGFVFKSLAMKAFAKKTIEDNNQPFDQWHTENFIDDSDETYPSSANNIYLLVAPRVITYENEAHTMRRFVENGNTLFIATNYFDPYILQEFNVNLQDNISLLSSQQGSGMRDTKKYLADTTVFEPAVFSFYFYPMHKFFVADSTVNFEVLGYNEFGKPDLIRIKQGQGYVILMTNVQACTNYFLLTKNNSAYALAAFSFLPVNASGIYWDDFYRRHYSRTPEGKSTFSALFSIPAFRIAFYILLLIAVLWIITNLPRRQRVIPILKPNVNSSIEFTQTIARLYFNKKDNRNIALKMIHYLQEFIKNKYYINYAANEEFSAVLAAKTGLPPGKIASLSDTIYTVQHNASIDDATLLQLNDQIQELMTNDSGNAGKNPARKY